MRGGREGGRKGGRDIVIQLGSFSFTGREDRVVMESTTYRVQDVTQSSQLQREAGEGLLYRLIEALHQVQQVGLVGLEFP